MSTVENRISRKRLRRAGDALLRAFSSHTPAGPGSLATGQAGAVRRGEACGCKDSSGPGRAAGSGSRSYVEFAASLRQVYWI